MNDGRRIRPVFSVWAWLLLTPYCIISLNGIDALTPPAALPAGISAAIGADIVLGIALLGFGAIERRLTRPAIRWSFVAAALIVCAYIHPLLLSVLQGALGHDLTVIPMSVRFVVNLVVLTVACLALHFLVEGLARNLAARDRLLLVEADLETQAILTEAYRDEIGERFLHEVAAPVIAALGRLFARELPPPVLAAELERVAHLIIPPVSERVDRAALEEALDDLSPTPETTSAFDAIRRFLSPERVAAAPAWIVALICLVLLPTGLALAPPAAVVAYGTAAVILAFPLGWVATRIRLPDATSRAIPVLAVVYLAVAAPPSLLIALPNAESPLFWAYYVYSVTGHAIVMVIVAVALSSFREIRAHRGRILLAISGAERRLAQARLSLTELSERLALVLREGVLADLAATSARLRSGAEDGELEALYRRVESALASAADGG